MSQLTDAPSADPIDRLAVRANDAIALIGRLALGWIFLSSGFGKLADVAAFSAVLAKRGVPAPSFMGWLGAIVEFGGGVLVILGLRVRYAALLLALFVVVATAISHRYWEYPVAEIVGQRNNFFKNLTIFGGMLFLFLHGAGRLSVDGLMGKKN